MYKIHSKPHQKFNKIKKEKTAQTFPIANCKFSIKQNCRIKYVLKKILSFLLRIYLNIDFMA